jgi:diaminohydroxyphosphoribosylaminopyrimidine deaminase/5-amino-6-(5-phosphoribosylamino)uracil reductase
MTNPYSKRLVHRWRSEVDAIMVGTGTVHYDNPRLNTRLYPGPSPIRIIPDRELRLPRHLHIFNDAVPTWVFTLREPPENAFKETEYIQIEKTDFIGQLLGILYSRRVQTLMIEGGKELLDYLADKGLWDEARVFTTSKFIAHGLPGPVLGQAPQQQFQLADDRLEIFFRQAFPG